jgi:glycosyltransferase involved in cell wall biosynthesis
VYKKNIFKIIDYIDAISMNYQKAYEKSSYGLWKLLYKIDKEKLIEYERKMLSYFDQKIIISDVDRNFILNGIEDKHFHTLYNSVNTANLNKPSKKEDNYIIFTGKMDYEPNINAVKYFSSKIFPSILNKYPDIQFIIAGVNPTKSVEKLALNNKNIIVTGYVKDLNSLILNSQLVVAPMISGAGIQNKILHAMALKKCVITTPIGAEGLNKLEKLNPQIVISDTIAKMIEDILNLLMNYDTRNKIGIAGFEYVKNNFSHKTVEEKLLSIIKI